MLHCNPEDTAEARRLVDEISDLAESLKEHEKKFINDLSEQFNRFGDATHISIKQLEWLRSIYEEVL